MLRSRSWRWLRTRIVGLLTADTRTARALAPPEPATPTGTKRREEFE